MAALHRHAHLPRRRPRQGHRRREIRRRVQRARPRLWQRRHLDRSPRAASRASMRARRCASPACSTCSPTRTVRAWRAHERRVQGRRRAGAGLAVPPALRRQDPVQRPADRAGAGRGMGDRPLRGLAGARRIREAGARHRSVRPTRPGLRGRNAGASRAARPTGLCGGRRASRSRILHSDRASQSDGAVRLDGDLGRRRQAHGLRQDPGRAERAALSVRRVQDEAGRCARDVALCRRRFRLGAASAISGGARRAGGARAGALGAAGADPPADVRARLSAGHDRAARASAPRPTARSTRSPTRRSR